MVADGNKAEEAATEAGRIATVEPPDWFSRPDLRFQPAAYWFWHSLPSTEQMRAQLADFKDKGYGTILIQARLGMPRHVYLSDPFLEAYGRAAEIMAELGLAGGIYDDYNWTSGQAAGHTVDGADHLRERHLFWAGGAEAAGTIRGIRAAFAEGMGADIADWHYERGRAVFADWQLVAACRHPAEIRSLSDVVDVTAEVSIHGGEGACDYSYGGTLAEGERLTVFVSARCVTSRLINYLMPEAGERFVTVGLEPVARTLSARDRHAVDFLFFDQPAPGFYDWPAREGALANSLLFTPEFGRELAEAAGQPLGSVLLALTREVGNDTARLRCSAFETYIEAIYRAFFEPLREFCRRQGLRFTGHEILPHVGSFALNGGFSSIDPRVVPAVDFFGLDALRDETAVDANNFEPQLSVKLGDSVARAHGRSRTLVEIYTTALRTGKRAAGQWELAPATLRAQSIRFHIQGARQVIFHALNQTPGEAGDHRLFVNPRFDFAPALNFEPWWNHHGAMADETARLSAFLEDMVPETPVAVFYPLHTAWSEGPRHAHARHFGAWCEALDRLSCGHMIVDEKSIASAAIENGSMRMNGLDFRALVLPSVTLIANAEVFDRIGAFQAGGGLVWITGDIPRLLGDASQSLPVQPVSAAEPTLGMIQTLCGSLAPSNVTIEASDGVRRISGRDGEGATRIVLFNEGEAEEDVVIAAQSAFAWEVYDCVLGTVAAHAPARRLELRLEPHELRCLRLHPASGGADVFRESRPQPRRSLVLDTGWTFEGPDGIAGPISVTEGWERQNFERFSGTGIYRRSLAIDRDADAVLELPGLAVAAVARLDGSPVGATAHPPFRIDLGRLSAGPHLLELDVSNTAANEYYADTPFAGDIWPDRSGLTAAPELHLYEIGKD